MSLTLLSIGGTDLTDYIDIQTYDVNNTEEYTEWIDANRIKHRDVLRTRLSGSFKLGFRSTAQVATFLSVLSTNIQSGSYYHASVFSNDDNQLHTADIFLDDVATIARDLTNNRVWHEYRIELEER